MKLGIQTWAGHQSHLPSVSLCLEYQSTARKMLLKYSRAVGRETKGHVGLRWVNSLSPTDGGRKEVSRLWLTPLPGAGGREVPALIFLFTGAGHRRLLFLGTSHAHW